MRDEGVQRTQRGLVAGKCAAASATEEGDGSIEMTPVSLYLL
jgi:hypothetical protein